ncbi:MAG TPA: F0F1 ATP synthase subunit delta [Candidatus Nanopelagicales bacterium]|nr:F0F1 ATP synthase subunit delta [Candidatus Nanopelagicales bacterium]
MLGSSRESLAALRRSLDARSGETGFSPVSGDLLAVAAVLGREKSLRQMLADSGQQEASRVGIVTSLFGGRISPTATEVLVDVVRTRWSSGADLVDALEILGAQAAFTSARLDGGLDRVETELFTFAQAVDTSPELQMALTDPSETAEGKSALVRDLVGATASPVTTSLLVHLAGNLRGRRPAAAVEELARLAAEERQRLLAEVRTAVTLTPEQEQRLAAALSRIQGRDVRINVILDPEVVGGIVVRVGDDVIDGSVASRLENARRTVGV